MRNLRYVLMAGVMALAAGCRATEPNTTLYAVTVQSVTNSRTLPIGTALDSLAFLVTNVSRGAPPVTFTLTKECTGIVSCPYQNADITLADGSSVIVWVRFDVGSFGDRGVVGLTASSVGAVPFSASQSAAIIATLVMP